MLALSGTLFPRIDTDGQAIDFLTPDGARVVRYAKLQVVDARGDALDAWMEVFAEGGARGIRIVYDDREAAYPVTVDPLITSPAWTAEAEQADAEFGFAVSTAGDLNGDGYSDVVVGAGRFDRGGGPTHGPRVDWRRRRRRAQQRRRGECLRHRSLRRG